MVKVLFFDFRALDAVEGFTRELEQPVKHSAAPLMAPDEPWENGTMTLYGSVVKAPGRPFQLWYTVIHEPFDLHLAYAESDDGIAWRKPPLDVFEYQGRRTNVVLTGQPHGAAVIYDEAEPRDDRRYKLVAGVEPSGCICGFHSVDGVHWQAARPHRSGRTGAFPLIATNPDCPMGFLRDAAGRYVVYHRLHSTWRYGFRRRVFRSESRDFLFPDGEPHLVLEPDAGDPPGVQFYGLGATRYGPYEIGTLWVYRTERAEEGPSKMRGIQTPEFVYARYGHAWHRAAQGTPFIPNGGPNEWDRGNLQCASAPVFLDDEIRYYYAGTDMTHRGHWELAPQHPGLGLATLKPDRFIALRAGDAGGQLTTVPLLWPEGELHVNARAEPDGWVKVEVHKADGEPVADCRPITGDSTAHDVTWQDNGPPAAGEPVRLLLRARGARVFSLYWALPGEQARYDRFEPATL